ncbi:hypothetical protein FRZ61_03180 [Hypericibacter adhaerens]|uniref:Inositolphosphotransferase Aur1/Ipt1 domain-containing protein n=1 Tax=Hypericibacter adhaerens TaxID=2602016 RepID=A0A5J6MT16_9PROT|nr:phosphatase PAP2 family protein [Hypericibacter adhaerens]QEX20401.1 hypothetical protein FRZ61_03180 [Hypericibacter adhaerens]
MSVTIPAQLPSSAAAAAFSPSWLARFRGELPGSLRRSAPILSLIAVYFTIGMIVADIADIGGITSVFLYVPLYVVLVPNMTVYLLICNVIRVIAAERPKRPLVRLKQEFWAVLATPQRLASALPILLFLPLFGSTFTMVKSTIPTLNPYGWDQTFEQWDRWLLGGAAPWELLHPLLGHPWITAAISWVYNLWFPMLAFMMTWQAFAQGNPRLRAQYFYATFLTWILLGNIAAIFLSSVGPCYFGRVVGGVDPYGPLMAYLREADQHMTVMSLWAQDMLWAAYQQNAATLGSGISAMPSLHVAMALIFVLVGWRSSRLLGLFFAGFFLVIAIGSIHLGWHYAVDGLAAILGVLAIWFASGWLARLTIRTA